MKHRTRPVPVLMRRRLGRRWGQQELRLSVQATGVVVVKQALYSYPPDPKASTDKYSTSTVMCWDPDTAVILEMPYHHRHVLVPPLQMAINPRFGPNSIPSPLSAPLFPRCSLSSCPHTSFAMEKSWLGMTAGRAPLTRDSVTSSQSFEDLRQSQCRETLAFGV